MVKPCLTSIEIGMHSPFGPRSPVEFEAFFQKKLGWPSTHVHHEFLAEFLLSKSCSTKSALLHTYDRGDMCHCSSVVLVRTVHCVRTLLEMGCMTCYEPTVFVF